MQRFTIADQRSRTIRVDRREEGVVAYVFRIREHAEQFACHESNTNMSVVEIEDFDNWLTHQQKNDVTHIVEVLDGLTRLIPIKTLANSLK